MKLIKYIVFLLILLNSNISAVGTIPDNLEKEFKKKEVSPLIKLKTVEQDSLLDEMYREALIQKLIQMYKSTKK